MKSSSAEDFDFLFGHWHVRHLRLRERLAGNDEWQAFDGTCSAQSLLGGSANIDDNVLHLPGGDYRALTLRSFDATSQYWAIWWLDSRRPHQLDTPVVGGFADGVGSFFADDTLDGRPIRVRFEWTQTDSASPRWEQAFSSDAGATWELNWTMTFTRMRAGQGTPA